MKKLYLTVLAGIFSLGIAPLAYADLKIGVVDVRSVLQKSPQMLVINAQLEKQFKPQQQEILEENTALKEEIDKLNKDGAVMKEADRTALQQEIIKDRTNVQNKLSAFQQSLAEAQNQATQKLVTQLNGVISNLAQAGKYDIVLQREAVPYFDVKYDITAQVSQAMNLARGK